MPDALDCFEYPFVYGLSYEFRITFKHQTSFGVYRGLLVLTLFQRQEP